MVLQQARFRETAGMDARDESAWRQASLSRPGEVVPLLEQVLAAMEAHGYSPRSCFEMRLALEEAVVNGLRHGNGGDPRKRVVLRYRVAADEVLAEVEDEGPGFDPATVPDPTEAVNLERPSGRGLLLIRHYTNWVRYQGRGNRVLLCKRRGAGR